ncbi:thiol-disulfide isomerase/thioredoxin [Tenacibaculum adriaticum]|uniref:Thiol-disulfide isomerase/thioredoxin n=1 Tax=Tenacibaculum adriaticum TaxID=413713 RepID=A0A5S5DY94_9FLAO|nr:TlpA disulfide reductase family protein [Tenacibaculum adriaticum]TYP99569.1 thiol-disulfide isomerase/thioredoxin [Tenacibaculum adriaticum]
MKKLLALLVFVTSIANAQYTIKGTMTPPDEGDWVILYKLEGANQKFVLNTTIKFETVNIGGNEQKIGRFQFDLPADTKKGTYRVTYRDKGAGFVDFLFNKENVEFIFNPVYPDQSIVFTKSIENKVYREYLEAVSLKQKDIDAIQVNYIKTQTRDSKKAYKKALSSLEDLQEIYEGKSKGMLAYHFIKSSKTEYPSSILENTQDYLNFVVDNFFTNVDFKSPELYNSSFLIDKVTDYVFLINVPENQVLRQKIYKQSITKVMEKVSHNPKLKKAVSEFLIERFTNARNSEIVDWLFADYYNNLPTELQDEKFKKDKVALLLATVGRIAPDFSWQEEGTDFKLSTLNDGDNYLLVFWSTQCSHCVEEIPQAHEFMKNYGKTSVVAFAIEQDDLDFNSWVKNKLYGWHNVMGTHPDNKWENETVQTYQLVGTPTYFVLDKNKKIIAMPNSLADVKDYFEKANKVAEE